MGNVPASCNARLFRHSLCLEMPGLDHIFSLVYPALRDLLGLVKESNVSCQNRYLWQTTWCPYHGNLNTLAPLTRAQSCGVSPQVVAVFPNLGNSQSPTPSPPHTLLGGCPLNPRHLKLEIPKTRNPKP